MVLVIRQMKNGETKFISVKSNIDVDRLKRGEYKIDDLIDSIGSSAGNIWGSTIKKKFI